MQTHQLREREQERERGWGRETKSINAGNKSENIYIETETMVVENSQAVDISQVVHNSQMSTCCNFVPTCWKFKASQPQESNVWSKE